MRQYLIYAVDSSEPRWMESRQDGTLPIPPDGYIFAEVRFVPGQTIDNFWIDSGTVRVRPNRPSRFHTWSGSAWVEDTERRSTSESETIRDKREQLLAESDWTDTLSAKGRLGPKFDEWQTYRQALRDITKQPGFPLNVDWPTPPS